MQTSPLEIGALIMDLAGGLAIFLSDNENIKRVGLVVFGLGLMCDAAAPLR